MLGTPRANRLHIAIFGRTNAGKSSLINALTGQEIALVSEQAGTTTDPVYKSMELLPIGPIVLIDTAGLDDIGAIGKLRIKRTMEVMDSTDLALLLFSPNQADMELEYEWYTELKKRNIPTIGLLNKIDIDDNDEFVERLRKIYDLTFIKVSAKEKINIDLLKEEISFLAPKDFEQKTLVGDIVRKNDLVLLVAPQNIQAPKGRLILPQVQVIRDVLDQHALVLTVTDLELMQAFDELKRKPDLVITDSQIFEKVNKLVPEDVPLTSFSIIMARYKGDLEVFYQGAKQISDLKPGDKVLIAEACTHHPLHGDIGRKKLPRWLGDFVGAKLDIQVTAGIDFPENIGDYKLIIHCGACMFNRKQMMTRILKASTNQVAITNYGVAIAYMKGILDRVMKVFKESEYRA